jgi:hypothetical protein
VHTFQHRKHNELDEVYKAIESAEVKGSTVLLGTLLEYAFTETLDSLTVAQMGIYKSAIRLLAVMRRA